MQLSHGIKNGVFFSAGSWENRHHFWCSSHIDPSYFDRALGEYLEKFSQKNVKKMEPSIDISEKNI